MSTNMARDFGRRCESGNAKRKAEEERRDQIMLSNTYKLTAYFAVQTREGDAAAVGLKLETHKCFLRLLVKWKARMTEQQPGSIANVKSKLTGKVRQRYW